MPFPRATPMSEVTFQRGRGAARGAVYESRSIRYRPRYIGRSTARRVGGAGSRSWWLHRRLRVENAAASAQDEGHAHARGFEDTQMRP